MIRTLLLFLLFLNVSVLAQDRFSSEEGRIDFEASVPLFEEIKAKNDKVSCAVELKTGEINCSVLIKDFQFKRELMQKHFNNNYLESDRYPKATFIGRISKFDYKFLTTTENEYQLKGMIRIHGKSKPFICKAWLKKTPKGIEINTNFVILTEDFNVEIPEIIANKISKEVKVQFVAHLKS